MNPGLLLKTHGPGCQDRGESIEAAGRARARRPFGEGGHSPGFAAVEDLGSFLFPK